MKKYISGISIGALAGVINCLFLLMASDLEVTVFISSFISWIVIGFLISTVDFKTSGLIKGIVVSFFITMPSLVYTIKATVLGALWTIFTTLLIGAFLGFLIEKVNKL